MPLPSKKTKIVCTLGPASQTQDVIERLIRCGMNVARINFAHGTWEMHAHTIATVRQAAAAVGQRVAVMGDLPGPKMRIGELAQGPVTLRRGQEFVLQTSPILGTGERVSLSFADLPRVVRPGHQIFMSDGYIQLQVERIVGESVACTVVVGGELRSRAGLNFPGIDLGISAFTEQDRELLAFAAAQHVDAISQSFVQGPEDIDTVRHAAIALDYHPLLIAKIERATAVDNLDAILQRADGIMVARGDLGVEIPIEDITTAQKHMIREANRYGKPVITATHMLESMIHNRRPTRAEATDVANAILDGTDCVMLSGETAIGNYPEEAVAVMARIAQVTEERRSTPDAVEALMMQDNVHEHLSLAERVTLGVYHSARELAPTLIFTSTETGATARRLARFKLPTWIVALSRHAATCQHLEFSYGVYPSHIPELQGARESHARRWCEQHGINGGLALLTEGTSLSRPGSTTHISILYI